VFFRKVFIRKRQNIRRGAWIARTGIFAFEIDDAEGGRDGRKNKFADVAAGAQSEGVDK